MLPQDPYMLLSYVNTKLRDEYDSPEAMCDDLGIDCESLTAKLHEAGFDYLKSANQFR